MKIEIDDIPPYFSISYTDSSQNTMAKKKQPKDTEVTDYRHSEKRKNIPESGLSTYYKGKILKKNYQYDPNLDPQLVWAGKHNQIAVKVIDQRGNEAIAVRKL